MVKMSKVFILSIMLMVPAVFAQLAQGPAEGYVSGGVIVSTTSFLQSELPAPKPRPVRQKLMPFDKLFLSRNVEKERDGIPFYIEDHSLSGTVTDTNAAVLLRNFNGINETNSIPPDPHIAVGPMHIIGTVNSSFAIWDKNGNSLALINASSWFRGLFNSVDPFDPKVVYDHYAKRWIMVWLDQSDGRRTGYFLVSVSDDSIPTGTWYNWALPSHLDGMVYNNSWGDYQGVGFDDKALYITSDQFSFDGYFTGVKIRIVPKAQLLLNNAGPVQYTDFWAIADPGNLSDIVFNIRPSISFTTSDSYNLLYSPYGGANYFVLYKITNPITSPQLTGVRIPTTYFGYPPNAKQLGGGSMDLETNGAMLTNEPVFRDGILYAVHATSNPTNPQYSALHYVSINTSTNTKVGEFFFGANQFYYFYPALTVDQLNNIAFTFGRSGLSQYAGAYFTCKLNSRTFPHGTRELMAGKANYVKDYGGGRNRWGDYFGIALDPENSLHAWMLSEFAAGKNTWGTWVGEMRMVPFSGASVHPVTRSLSFKPVEVGFRSDTLTVSIANFGTTPFTVDSITTQTGKFKFADGIFSGRTLTTYDTLSRKIFFEPTQHQLVLDTVVFYSSGTIIHKIPLDARGFIISKANERTIYASDINGNIYVINAVSGNGSLLGNSGANGFTSIAVHPKTGILYGIRNSNFDTQIYRINASGGDAYQLMNISEKTLHFVVFDSSGTLFLIAKGGDVFTCNLLTGVLTAKPKIKTSINSITINTLTNECFASAFKALGTGKDRIIKVNLSTGDTATVGFTGFGTGVNAMYFNDTGKLFGVKGTSSVANEYFEINTLTGAGTIIGQTGVAGISGMAYFVNNITGAEETIQNNLVKFTLSQNYPNPFNPSTTISFTLTGDSYIKLVVYNPLGEIIAKLAEGKFHSGTHNIVWNSKIQFQGAVPSGIYFYELSVTENGITHKEIRKMNLIK